jgi:hypothetical protein
METLIKTHPLAAAQEAIDNAVVALEAKGKIIKLDNWLTIKRYCEKFGIKDTEVVSNWIKRGKIPADCIETIEELNGIRLIKAIPYK